MGWRGRDGVERERWGGEGGKGRLTIILEAG